MQSALKEFKRPIGPHVTAAQVGISYDDWCTVAPNPSSRAEEQAARERMTARRFDVLPVARAPHTSPSAYYITHKAEEYSRIEKRQINYATDTLPPDTPLAETIARLRARYGPDGRAAGRQFFFLIAPNQEIIGLISTVNLLGREASVFLYGYFVELELRLSQWLSTLFDEARLESLSRWMMQQQVVNASGRDQALYAIKKAVEDYGYQRERYRARLFSDHLYFRALLDVLHATGLYSWLGYPVGKGDVWLTDARNAGNARNQLAHPLKSAELRYVLTNIGGLQDLAQAVARETAGPMPPVQAYANSEFRAITLSGLPVLPVLRIGQPYPAFQEHASVAFITSDNPFYAANSNLTETENATRRTHLRAKLLATGVAFVEAYGEAVIADSRGCKFREDGFLLLDVSREHAIALGSEYEQAAIVYLKRGGAAELLACPAPAAG